MQDWCNDSTSDFRTDSEGSNPLSCSIKKGRKKEMAEKYYKAYLSAEEEAYGVVKLTEEEHKAVVKFLNQVHEFSYGWCGSCDIDNVSFNTIDEVQESLYKEIYPDLEQ